MPSYRVRRRHYFFTEDTVTIAAPSRQHALVMAENLEMYPKPQEPIIYDHTRSMGADELKKGD